MPNLQGNNQEPQISPEDQKQLWRMRWFLIVFLAFWAIMILLALIVVLYIAKTSALPLASVISGLGLIPAFGALMRQPIRYLFPMGRGELELAKEKARLTKQKEDTEKVTNKTRMDKKTTEKEMLHQSRMSLVQKDDSTSSREESRQ